MRAVRLLPPQPFLTPFAAFGPWDFADFDFTSSPMYDSLGYQPLTTGGKTNIQFWTKGVRNEESVPDLSVETTWHDSEATAKDYMVERLKGPLAAATGKRFKLPEEPVYEIRLLSSDETVVGMVGGYLISVRARYANYFFNLIFALSSKGYFPTLSSVLPFVAAFDQQVSNVLRENA